MYDPRKVFTEDGHGDYLLSLGMMERAVDFLMDHADDLHIGGTATRQGDLLYALPEFIRELREGPFDEGYDGAAGG